MAVQKGSAVLIGLSDGASPPNYTTSGGDVGCEFEFEDGTGEYTNKSSSGLWQEIMDGGTVRRLRATLNFVDIDDASLQTVFAALMGASARHQALQLTLPGFGTIVATWHINSFQYSGEVDNPARGVMQIQSAAAPTFTAT
jgi:predicted secreted protein